MLFDYLMKTLKFAFRQQYRLVEGLNLIKKLATFQVPFKKIAATFVAISELFCSVVTDSPVTPYGEELNLDGYQLVYADEFDGEALNTDEWTVIGGRSRGGFVSDENVAVRDGKLILTGDKKDGRYGEGWYGARIQLNRKFCKGYFEIKAKIPTQIQNNADFWAAFWMTASGCYDPAIAQGGRNGIELDIMEANGGGQQTFKPDRQSVTCAVWTNGIDDDDTDDADGLYFGRFYLDKTEDDYHTFGLKWTDTEYIWYYDGVEAFRTDYGKGICEVPEEIIISLELPTRSELVRDENDPAVYEIEYLRVYQLA